MKKETNLPEWYVKYVFECECNGEIPIPIDSLSKN